MKKILLGLVLIMLFIFIGCSQTTDTNNDKTTSTDSVDNNKKSIQEDKNLIETVKEKISFDSNFLEEEVMKINEENKTFVTNVDISKTGNDIKIDITVTPDTISKFILNSFTLIISDVTYKKTKEFNNIKFTYLNEEKRVLGTMIIPKKAIEDVVLYLDENEDSNMLETPYTEAFWEISKIMYDESVPELVPNSLAEDMFDGSMDDADEIAEALKKEVTHLEISCNFPENWDSDADDDGIIYYIKPLSSDNTIVPIEGKVETKIYEQIQKDDWGFEFEKGKLLSTITYELKGQERFKHFSTWTGYSVSLEWDGIEPYMASSSDEGILYVTLIDLNGNKFEAKTGEGSYDNCRLRE